MSSNEEDPNVIALRAERDLNSSSMKEGTKPGSDSAQESGVDQDVEKKFEGAEVRYGSEATGAGDNREIPDDQGGEINPETGKQTKARDFEGVGGPEEKMAQKEAETPGDQDVTSNVR